MKQMERAVERETNREKEGVDLIGIASEFWMLIPRVTLSRRNRGRVMECLP